MKHHSKKKKILLILALIFAVIGVAALVLTYFIEDIKLPLLICGGVTLLIALVLMIIGYAQSRMAKNDEERDERTIKGALGKLSYAEKVNIAPVSDSSLAIVTMAGINEASEIRSKEILPFGEYEEEEFDDLVIRSLTRIDTPLGCLAYFKLFCEETFDEQGPLEALAFMVKQNFGENLYYGKIKGGIAVFSPFVCSKEEAYGRARRVAQLYSYTQGDKHIFSKGSVVFYPDFSPRVITSAALKGLVEAEPLKIGSLEEPSEHYGFPSAEKENAQIALVALRRDIRNAVTEEEVITAVKKYGRNLLVDTGMDTMGIAIYDDGLRKYRLPCSISLSEDLDVYAKSKNEEGYIDALALDPFYDWGKENGGIVMVNQPTYLTSDQRANLDSFSIEGYAASAISYGDRKLGLVYFASQQKEALSSAVYASIDRITQILTEAGVKLFEIIENKKELGRKKALYGALSIYHLAIDEESLKVTYISPSLEKAMPALKIGQEIPESLLSAYRLCLQDGQAERPLLELGSGTFTFITRPGYKEREIFISARKEDFSSSRIDVATELLNDKALHEDLQKEILQKNTSGQILGFRIRNAESLFRQFRLENYDPLLSAVSRALIAASLDGSLYRNGEAGFAYLLPNLSRTDAIELSSLVARTLREKLPLGERAVEFAFDYCLIAYPIEAANPFDMDSLLRVLYEKADASSKGRLFENSSPAGLIADKRSYARDKFEEAIRSGSMPLRYAFFAENASRRIAFIESVPTIVQEDGSLIQGTHIEDIAIEANKRRDLAYTSIRTLSKMLGKYKKQISDSSLVGAILPIDIEAVSPKFIEATLKELRKTKANPSHLYIELLAEDVIASPKAVESFVKKAKKYSISVGVRGSSFLEIDKALVPYFAYYRFSSSLAYGQFKDRFIASLADARGLGLSFLVDGVTSREEGHYLGSMSLHYGKMQDNEPIDEEGIESYLVKK